MQLKQDCIPVTQSSNLARVTMQVPSTIEPPPRVFSHHGPSVTGMRLLIHRFCCFDSRGAGTHRMRKTSKRKPKTHKTRAAAGCLQTNDSRISVKNLQTKMRGPQIILDVPWRDHRPDAHPQSAQDCTFEPHAPSTAPRQKSQEEYRKINLRDNK